MSIAAFNDDTHEPDLVTVHRDNFEALNTRYGVYIIQSQADSRVFRVGASGINNRGTLKSRFQTHRRKATIDGLWTNRNRPWLPIWVAEHRGVDGAMTGAIERILYVNLIHHFKVADVSGFEAPPQSLEKIHRIADSQRIFINEFIERQTSLSSNDEWARS